MKFLFNLTFLLLFLASIGNAQNLVPNGDFESYSICPGNYGELYKATPWFQPTAGTSDYLNACHNGVAGVPVNFFGNQPARSGSGYAGFFVYHICNLCQAREYIEVELTSPLVAGLSYYVNFHVVLAGHADYQSSNIGAYFSDSMVTSNDWEPLPYTPQIVNPDSNLIYYGIWKKISGNYMANGGEKFMTIGGFKPDSIANTVYTGFTNQSYIPNSSYYHIDDVCVSLDSNVCLVAPLSTSDNQLNKKVQLYPNPFDNKLNIENSTGEVLLTIYDMSSRRILSIDLTGSEAINTSQLKPGLYFYEVRKENTITAKGKIMKE